MSVNAPFSKPEVPSPATVRPIMKKVDEVATPQSKEPTSKMATKTRNVRLALR
jgi:hypothetical protein